MKTLLKTLLATLPAVTILFFSSCLSTDGENSQTFVEEPLIVVSSSLGTTSVKSNYGTFYASQFSDYTSGDCLIADFKIDFDNQPQSSGLSITEVTQAREISKKHAHLDSDSISAEYSLPIHGTAIYRYVEKHIILKILQKANQAEKFAYEAVWVADGFIQKSYPTLYLRAKALVPTEETLAKDYPTEFAFNISEFIDACGTEYITEKNGVKQLTFHIKYKTDKEVEGKPQFAYGTSSPYTIAWDAETE